MNWLVGELNKQEMASVLRAYCGAFSTQKEAAKALGITAQYLSDMLNGYRNIGPTVANRLGYQHTIVYRPNQGNAS